MSYYDNPGTNPDEAINVANGKVFKVVQLADSSGNIVNPGTETVTGPSSTAYKVLGQSAPVAATATTLYTVPASKSAVSSTLVVCNRGASTFFRVAVQPAGATLSNQHYIVYDGVVNQYESVFLTLEMTLATTDVVTVYATAATLSFSLFGSEVG